jgi:2-oxoisovalerate dehydrogenase E1 component
MNPGNHRSVLDTHAKHASAIRTALTIRFTEQRLLDLFAKGKLFGTVHTCIGQELVGVSVARCLSKGDYIFSNHRCHGHFLACRDNVEGLIAEIMGKSSGVCAGLGGSQHLYQDGFFSNGVQGGICPVATGLALAQKLRGQAGIAVVFIGDGTLGEGVLYESLNIASKWELPLLVVLENNLFAQSTSQSQTLAGSIRQRFEAFGIEASQSNTWEWERLFEEMASSVGMVRQSGRARFHQVDTYRLMAHSKGDDNRPSTEVEPYRKKDPLNVILEDSGELPWLRQMQREIEQRIDCAVQAAESTPFAVLAEDPKPGVSTSSRRIDFDREKTVNAIRQALDEALRSRPEVILLGEDIESPYGGAFKATLGLSEAYPGRVRNTPISEAAIVGISNGLALAGYIPVVEVMFGDFLTLATDQWVNHAAKFAAMYNQGVKVPMIVRTPMGGRRGYGPTHSQSIERLFLSCPGTRVLCLHHRYSPRMLYRTLFATIDRPTLVVENKTLYGGYVEPTDPPGYSLLFTSHDFPVANLHPHDEADITIVAIGGMSQDAEEAAQILFEEHEILADLFFPAQLYPLDASFLWESLSRTKRLLVVEEGQGFASVSSEILAQVAEAGLSSDMTCVRVAAGARPIPSARPLEATCLPDAQAIASAATKLVNE